MTLLVSAVGAFADRLGSVDPRLLALALLLHLGNLLLRATAWRAVLCAAHPGICVRWSSITGAYLAGVGVNSIAPARAGDVVKVGLAHRAMPGSTCTTVATSLVAESALDVLMGILIVVWAVQSGAVPNGIDPLSTLPGWPGNGNALLLAIAVVASAITIGMRLGGDRLRGFLRRARHGLAIFRRPGLYLRAVAAPQLLGWCLRAAAIACFLDAFGISAGPAQVGLVLAAGTLAALVPAAPGGAGAQQALLLVLLRSVATGAAVLSFSLGMQLVMTLLNVLLGAICIVVMVRRVPWRVRLALNEPEPVPVPVPVRVER